jgi:hypothetical protein
MTFPFNPTYPDATNDQKWEQIKLWRDSELVATDWTMLSDAPTDKVAWANYRQEVRDVTNQGGDADDAIIPTRP